MEVRPARPEDVRGIAETHVRTWQGAYRHAFPAELLDGLSVDGHEEWWRGVVESNSEEVWVAVEDGAVIGFASAGPSRTEEDVAELYALYVLPHAWGSGAGTALMRTAIDWFLAEEHVLAMLWVLDDSPRARRFYEREGWRHEGERTAIVRGVEVREALYRLSLAGA